MTQGGHEQKAGLPAPCSCPSIRLLSDFEVADVVPAVGSFESNLLLVFPVEGELPQKPYPLDAPQEVFAVPGILHRILNLNQ